MLLYQNSFYYIRKKNADSSSENEAQTQFSVCNNEQYEIFERMRHRDEKNARGITEIEK